MAIETELKFQVPRGHRGALREAVATTAARSTRLQALYADTAGSHLAAAGMVLRLRKEGRLWVQTLKGRGDGLASRFEHEVVLRGVRGLPTLDPSRHDGSALAESLQHALRAGGDLQPVYRTDIRRLHRRLRHQGAVIELALDRGHLIAGDRRLAVHEIEFELISGPLVALPLLAARWALRHALWWDVRTKSELGFRLAHGPPVVPALRGEPAAGNRAANLQAVLAHALPNAAELAGGSGQTAHLHELRLALQALVLASEVALAPSTAPANAGAVAAASAAAAAAAADQARLLLAALEDAAAAPAVARSAAFTALMLAVLQQAMRQATHQPMDQATHQARRQAPAAR